MHVHLNNMLNFKRQTLYDRQGGLCLYCKTKLQSHLSGHACLDHIYPKSQGGGDDYGNIALVCYRCNSLKSDFTSLWQVVRHFSKVFVVFFRLLGINKVQKALRNGKMMTREAEKHCASCTCHGREKIPNAVSKMGTPPINANHGSLRVEAYQRRFAAFQRIKGASVGGTSSSETPQTSS